MVAGGGATRIEHTGGVIRSVVRAYAELARPPFYLLLTRESGRSRWREACNLLPWLSDRPGQVREVSLVVPVIETGQVYSFTSELRRRGDELPMTFDVSGERVIPIPGRR
jgi:hypothetical protein